MTNEERTEEFAHELGQLSIKFSAFEAHIKCVTAFLANPSNLKVGHLLVVNMAVAQLLDMLSKLYRMQYPTAIQQLDKFLENANKARMERNDLIHGFYWMHRVGNPNVLRNTAKSRNKQGVQIDSQEISPQQVKGLADSVERLSDDLDVLFENAGQEFVDYHSRFYGLFGEPLRQSAR